MSRRRAQAAAGNARARTAEVRYHGAQACAAAAAEGASRSAACCLRWPVLGGEVYKREFPTTSRAGSGSLKKPQDDREHNKFSSMAAADSLHALPDELLLAVSAFLDLPRDLLAFQAVGIRHRALPSADLWRLLCTARWQRWPRYRLTEARERWLEEHFPATTWMERYRVMELDTARSTLTHEELQSLCWHVRAGRYCPAASSASRSHAPPATPAGV